MKYYKNLSINESDFSVQRQGCRIHLTTTEYQLFITLLDHSGHICSRNFLLASAWNITVPIQTRTVDVHIAKLRKKLDLGPDDLKTVMGRGYALSMHESCRANRSLWTSHYNKKGAHCIYTAVVDPHVQMQMFSRGTSCVADVGNAPPVLHLLNGGDAAAVTMCIPKSFNT